MKINRLELKGFGSYKEHNVVEFQDGITGIIGVYDNNENRSNGSGKSTLVMAIIYALFGEGEFSKLDEIVNDSLTDKEMFVRLEFTLNSQQYRVERGRVKSSSYLDFYENDVPLTKERIEHTQEEIIRVLGMDYKMCTASNFFEQGNIDNFINATPEERRNYVDKVLDLEIWRIAYKTANKANKLLISARKTLVETSKIKIEEMDDLKIKVAEKKTIAAELDDLKKKKKELQDEIIKYDNSLQFTIKLNELRQQRFDAEKGLKEFDDIKVSFTNSINTDQLDIIEITNKLKAVGERGDFDDTQISSLKTEQDIVENKLGDINQQLNKYNVVLAEYSTRIRLLTESKSKMKEGVCPSCFQDVDPQYLQEKQKEFNAQIIELTGLATDTSKNVTDFQTRKLNLEKTIKEFKESITATETMLANIIKNKNELEKEKLLKEQNIEKLELQMNQATEKNRETELSVSGIKKQIREIEKVIDNFVPDKVILDKMKADVEFLEESIEVKNRKLGELSQLEKNKDKLEVEIENIDNDIEETEESIYLHGILINAFQEIPRNIFQQSVILIQDAANEIIQQILPDISVNIFEDTSKSKRLIISFIIAGRERSYKRLSGGEKVVANIGLRLGFSKVIRYRSKINLGLITLDEPFGFLDNHNKYLVQKVLTLILNWFDQILVISHVDHIQDFPQIITVRKTEDNISYVN